MMKEGIQSVLCWQKEPPADFENKKSWEQFNINKFLLFECA